MLLAAAIPDLTGQQWVPQVIYRFALELGMVPLTGTTDVSHMREALDIFDFTLTHNEIETLLTLRGPH